MNLVIFPESASLNNGYGIAVNHDYQMINPTIEDHIIWYTNDYNNPKFIQGNYIIKRPKIYNLKRIINISNQRVSTELTLSDLNIIKEFSYKEIFCDDVICYRAIRKLFPKNKITVRFHNCFSRILERKKILGINLDFKFELNLYLLSRLEKEIFRDINTKKIFITEEDDLYYKSITGRTDSSVWLIPVNKHNVKTNNSNYSFENKIVWFGGIESHKKISINWFIKDVYPLIQKSIPDIEFHLWGRNTEFFNKESKNIFGHGIYNGSDLPYRDCALFINPDIIGGGVKIKLKSYFENGVRFITTPFGFEGYNKTLIDNKYCYVKDTQEWVESIISIIKKQ